MIAPASDAVRSQWGRQVVAEYRSSAVAQQLTLWLTQLGASPDLIQAGLRIAQDELDHARESFDVYRAAGGTGATALDRATLAIEIGDRTLERATLDIAVNAFCLGETLAVPLFRHLRAGCEVEAPRASLDRIVKDEPRHSSFGWDLLDWLLDGPCAGEHAHVERILPAGFRELERAYGNGAENVDRNLDIDDSASPPMPAAERAWGLAPRHEYAEILASTFDRIWRPRFAAYGIDVTPLPG